VARILASTREDSDYVMSREQDIDLSMNVICPQRCTLRNGAIDRNKTLLYIDYWLILRPAPFLEIAPKL
jgi:hypothetical protein